MSDLIGIVGKNGTGKSSAIRTLSPKETYVISVAGKSLPFKGAKGNYKPENKNYTETTDFNVITGILKGINEKRKDIKNIVIDDGQYLMAFEYLTRADENGYKKFSDIGKKTSEMFRTARDLREDLKVFVLWHPEISEDGEYKMKTVGKMIDSYLTLEGLFEIVLYTNVEVGDEGAHYQFITNRTSRYPAKSPMGMFEEGVIPNDLQQVVNAVDNFNKA